MRYLLDTHVALWLFAGSEKLSKNVQDIIFDANNEMYVSIASVWEVAIKVSRNKLDFTGGSREFVSAIEANHIDLLGINHNHVNIVEKLPFIHGDPFDRMIISSAISENLTIITIDENIQKYDVSWVW